MDLKHIRNFSIIAHIDHGKSTLADRMLEITHTIEKRKMRDQVLDSMELERERGITIKMQPVRMEYNLTPSPSPLQGEGGRRSGEVYILNLIDTPGHIDFSYEVSRALKAVEGSILLIDSTQGVQAQTLTTLAMAREGGLKIIPVLSKIDSPLSRVDEIKDEVLKLLDCDPNDVLLVSGRTGEGVDNLLKEIIKRVPEPKATYESQNSNENNLRALVFDFKYSNHRGVIVFVRILDGRIAKRDSLIFAVSGEKFTALEVGTFSPEETPRDFISTGETGYIVTGIKKSGIASVGDTITMFKNPLPAFEGYMKPMPVVWASVFPEDADDFTELKLSLGKLSLSDSSFSYEEENSGSLGKGFRLGFLGMLHLEIITERLKREFNLKLIITTPSITYEVVNKQGKKEKIYSPYFFPDDGIIETVFEPWVDTKIITPAQYLGNIMQLLFDHEAEIGETDNFGDSRSSISVKMPLRELMRNFFDELKSVSSGYGSISYKVGEMREANVTRLDILVADEVVPAFSKVISKKRVEEEAQKSVDRLEKILPR
ncbi:MAG TPA: translation elongation factor 4, partial [Candidatus Paceibacterota bacterium]|nr:translation elongation factor 4 [Candidatus Paceibacterota bacterium]